MPSILLWRVLVSNRTLFKEMFIMSWLLTVIFIVRNRWGHPRLRCAGGFARWAQGRVRVGLCFASARLLHRRFCPFASFGAILVGSDRVVDVWGASRFSGISRALPWLLFFACARGTQFWPFAAFCLWASPWNWNAEAGVNALPLVAAKRVDFTSRGLALFWKLVPDRACF